VDGRLELIFWDQVVDFVPAIEQPVGQTTTRPAPVPVAMPVTSQVAQPTL